MTANKAIFAFCKVVQQHYSGEVCKFTIFWCKFPWDSVHTQKRL